MAYYNFSYMSLGLHWVTALEYDSNHVHYDGIRLSSGDKILSHNEMGSESLKCEFMWLASGYRSQMVGYREVMLYRFIFISTE